MFGKYLPQKGIMRRQIIFLRCVLIFLICLFLSDFLFENKIYSTIFSIILSFSGLITRPLNGFSKVWLPRFYFVLGAPICLLSVEILNNTNPFEALSVAQCIFNFIWYYMLFVLIYIFSGRLKLTCILSTVFFALIGTANHYVLTFRGSVIFPCDIFTWQTAANVSSGFDFTPDQNMIEALLLCFAYIILILLLPKQNKPMRPKKIISLGLCALSIIYCAMFFYTDMLETCGIYSQQWKTQANGFVLNFTASMRYSIVSQPEIYSSTAVRNIIDSVQKENTEDNPQPVHIIAIMNESFSDFAYYDVPLSDDPTPFLHSLSENTIKGTMYSPVHGGGTANVEFEFLTGNSLSFLPDHSVAYQLYLKENTPSLVSQFKEYGYSTIAYHPYLSSGWNRTSVYEWMGFDRQMYQEDTVNPEYIRGFISDQCDYDNLYRLTDEAGDNPLFIFNVTMQNHSGYKMPWTNLDRTIRMDKYMENRYPEAEQYFSLIKASDDALRNLISHYSCSDVPTMIIFFGDHQPPLPDAFYEEITGSSMESRNASQILAQYTTPFFIWTNYDIEEKSDIILSSWGLGVLAAKTAGIELTGYQSFLSDLMEEVPVITPYGSILSDGTTISPSDEYRKNEQQTLVTMYEFLQYNCIFDDKERQDDFFFLNSDK